MATDITPQELQLATRNHGMPLEALRLEETPAGLHYVLVHYDIPALDAGAHVLSVDGLVEEPLSLGLDELRARFEVVELAVTMECAGNGRALLEPRPRSQPWLREAVGTARWRGVRVRDVLAAAGVGPGAVEVVFTGVDEGIEGGVRQHYARALPLDEAAGGDALLAFEMNGAPLPLQHGFPLRMVVPGWYGMTNVKWLRRITVLDRAFDGYQNAKAYRWRRSEDDAGEPVTRMAVRSLMAPPGIPDFFTRSRTVGLEPCELVGRAWSGRAPITGVEVSTDGGASWSAATLDAQPSPWAWAGWRFAWRPEPGTHLLGSRATDATGATQPLQPHWNVGGYANNAVHWVTVEAKA